MSSFTRSCVYSLEYVACSKYDQTILYSHTTAFWDNKLINCLINMPLSLNGCRSDQIIQRVTIETDKPAIIDINTTQADSYGIMVGTFYCNVFMAVSFCFFPCTCRIHHGPLLLHSMLYLLLVSKLGINAVAL